MTCKADKLRTGREHDRRIKLTIEQKEEIKANKDGLNIWALSRAYKVSRRLIQFILFPERYEKNKADRLARGGWKQYYNKEEWSKTMREP